VLEDEWISFKVLSISYYYYYYY